MLRRSHRDSSSSNANRMLDSAYRKLPRVFAYGLPLLRSEPRRTDRVGFDTSASDDEVYRPYNYGAVLAHLDEEAKNQPPSSVVCRVCV